MPKIKKINLIIFSFLVIVAVLVWIAVFQSTGEKNQLQLIFCDVGQGDAILIKIPNQDRDEVLVDGGPDNSVLSCLGENLPFYDRKIKSVVLTHPDKDHLAGLIEVLKRYQVEEVWWTGVVGSTVYYREFLATIADKKVPTKIARAGDPIIQEGQIKLKVLYPVQNYQGKKMANLNDSSIVLRLIFRQFSALLPGDLPDNKQTELLSQNLEIKSRILKVSHHGSKNGLATEFLSQVNPGVAVISVGAGNRYGHPTAETLGKLTKIVGLKIYRTDLNGEIKINSDGSKYWVETEK